MRSLRYRKYQEMMGLSGKEFTLNGEKTDVIELIFTNGFETTDEGKEIANMEIGDTIEFADKSYILKRIK